MSDLPNPLTPADCDLRDFAFMPLDVARLMDSSLFARSTGDEFKAAVALWCKAWMQVPAGSLPDDPRDLAYLSGAGSRWNKVKTMALHGWIRCTDGRLYHPVVAEKANEAWKKKQVQRERSKRGNEVRWGKGAGSDVSGGGSKGGAEPARSDVPDHPKGSPKGNAKALAEGMPEASPKESLKDRKGQGQGQGQREEPPSPPSAVRSLRGCRLPDGWEPDTELVAFARGLGLEPTHVAAQFRDYWHAKAGKDAAKVDWPATWRGWCRREVERRPAPAASQSKLDWMVRQ